MKPVESDYLIVGAGACGLAFADTLLSEAPNATITIVDERAAPGGHWIDAYDFVKTHQPASFYGVNSTQLGHDRIDETGLNAGFYDLASGAEIRAYFGDVMERVLLASGRVRYIPKSRYDFERRVLATSEGEIAVRARKIVDTTYTAGPIPATHTPSYSIAPGVRHAPVNVLSGPEGEAARYVIIGAGKTGADACVYLIERGVDPDAITWIMPQDVWFYDRALYQPGDEHLDHLFELTAVQMEIAATAQTANEVLARLEQSGTLMRIDPCVTPGAYRCATITRAEMDVMKRVKRIVRLGRVQRLEAGRIVLDRGGIPTGPDVLHVDCSAKAVRPRPPLPVFDGDRITVQFVRTCQPPFCAAFIALVEAHFEDEAKRNLLCTPVPSPERAIDWLSMTLQSAINTFAWMQEPVLANWLARSRLNGQRGLMRPSAALTPVQTEARKRMRAATPAAVANLRKLIAASH